MLLHSKFSLFILLSIYFRFTVALNCSDEPFDCGIIGYIAYPFWGGLRTSECGRQSFEIICNNNNPIINISSLSYQVQKLDFVTNTLTVARQDLQDTYCPHPLRNTTIDSDLFHYPPNSTDRNLTLYFDCTAIHPVAELPNAFRCANQTSNLFKIGGDPSSPSPSPGIVCDANIYVPINNEDALSLQNPTPSSINVLRSALDAGFSIQWFNDTKQGTDTFCNKNVNGSCLIAYSALKPSPCNRNIYGSCLPNAAPNRSRCTDGNACRRGGDNATSPAPVGNEDSTPVSSPSPNPSPSPSPMPMPPIPTPAHSPTYALSLVPTAGLGKNTTQDNNNANNRVKKIVLVVPLTVACIILASISVFYFMRRLRLVTAPYAGSKHDVETLLLQQGSLAPKRYTYSEIKKMTKSFCDKLGHGGYGSVYKGMLRDGRLVAVKMLFQIDSNGEEFINEVASISRTSHVNIVALLGFCYEGNRRALVYEFMPNSSLDKFMFLNHNQSEYGLDFDKLFKIAVGIAKGLEYLHKGCKTRIVHFDIKPQNILLDDDLCPKISDFGLAKLYKKKQSLLSSMMGTRGTAGYIAPEVFSRNFGEVSHKSDVYSYGMMLLEMAQGRKLDEADPVIQSSESCFPDKIYEEIIRDVADIIDPELEGEEEKKRKMLVVGLWCIQTNPSNRPPISRVLEMLEGSLKSLQIPPKPFLFSPNLPHHSE